MENLEKETLIQKIKDLEVILKEMDLKIETAKKEVKMLENNKEKFNRLIRFIYSSIRIWKKRF